MSLIRGALTLRTTTFAALRERSDVFYRGFLLMLTIALIVGAFEAGARLVTRATDTRTLDQVTAEALRGQENIPPGTREMVMAYTRESVAIGYEIEHLAPRAGESARPVAALLHGLGETLAAPFSAGFLGFVLLAGLLVHFTSRWLGGQASFPLMLGLTALSYAPDLLRPVGTVLTTAGNLGGVAALGALSGVIGLIVVLWETAIYVKATAIAQNFPISRAIGAILLALLIAVVIVLVCAVVIFAIFGGIIAALAAASR